MNYKYRYVTEVRWIIFLIGIVTIFVFLSGCLPFGGKEVTENPTSEQVNKCRDIMFLNPSLEIEPLGYKYLYGMDDAIWFKFRTNVQSMDDIFLKDKVDVGKFSETNVFLVPEEELEWWDFADKELIGGQLTMEKAEAMNIGIGKDNTGFIVYIFWFQT